MLDGLKFPETLEYSSDSDYLPIEFYLSTIPKCKKIELKLGYFSSNAIRTLSYGFAQFIYNGGTLKIITNHFLSRADKKLLLEDPDEGFDDPEIKKYLTEDLEGLAEILKNGDQHFFDCLKYLYNQKQLVIQPVKIKPNGLSHYKQGLLFDGTNTIYFRGSCNFTYNGLMENGEEISLVRSWGESSEREKVKEKIKNFESIFAKENDYYHYLSVDEIIEVIQQTGKDKDIDELVEDEINVLEKIQSNNKFSKSFKRTINEFKQTVNKEKTIPKFPFPKGPHEYQKNAYENWKNNNYQGIFAMATGTGKTVTALNCILNEYNLSITTGGSAEYNILILVPTVALVSQWEKECKAFRFNNVIKVNSRTNWNESLAAIQTLSSIGYKTSFAIISTYASFVKKRFQDEMKKLPKDTILIADETHNIGAPTIFKTLPKIHFERRIGLSATPERQFAEEENKKIKEFFNEISDNHEYTFEYTMEDAITKEPKALCPYRYFPRRVDLTNKEFKEYLELTGKIARLQEPRTKEQQKLYEIYTLQRQRIIHKATNKIEVFKEIIQEEFNKRGDLKYTLVYTPEGISEEGNMQKVSVSTSDRYLENSDDMSLINEYTKEISKLNSRLTVKRFIGSTPAQTRDTILKDFACGKTQILTSMKCLDEGVDVPRAELAIFCSSTGNPRQFIQRRGRVLRKHRDKKEATIYDLIVVPEISGKADYYNTEKKLIEKELKRVRDFARLSENPYEARKVLDPIIKYYDLTI